MKARNHYRYPLAAAGENRILWTLLAGSLFASTALAQISLVRVTSCGPTNFPSSCAIPATGTGNLIVVGWQTGGFADTNTVVSSMTDNAGNTYAQAGAARAIDSPWGAVTDIWFAKDSRPGATSVTITPSAGTTNTGVVIWEFSGVDRNVPLGTASALNSQQGASSASGTVTTSGPGVVISLAAFSSDMSGLLAPFTTASSLKGNGWAHYIAPAAGTHRAQWSLTSAGSYCSSTVWFRAATGPGPVNACDLSGDGVVNTSDVDMIVSMVLGNTPCTANIEGSGICQVTTVQRVVNASLPGGQCVTSGSSATYTVSGAISPGASGSGSTVALSGAGSSSATADGSGNFSFGSVPNGVYTVTPSKAGFTFSPTSLQVTVNNANVTGIAFSITQNQPQLNTLSCSPSSFTTPGSSTCTVSLTGTALTGGLSVTLSDNHAALTVPASVTVAAGSQTANFTATATLVTSSQNATVTATAAGIQRTFGLTLLPASAVPHSVTLTWGASPSSNVVGYNLYRGSVSGGPYVKLNSSLISGLTYVDTTVSGGVTYFYVATAVNSSSLESGYSPQAQATIPSP